MLAPGAQRLGLQLHAVGSLKYPAAQVSFFLLVLAWQRLTLAYQISQVVNFQIAHSAREKLTEAVTKQGTFEAMAAYCMWVD
jgi:hypothetical protein